MDDAVSAVAAAAALDDDWTGIFKIFINATRNGNTMVVDAVIDPVMVSRKTGRHATKNVAIIGLFPRYNMANEYAILLSSPHR